MNSWMFVAKGKNQYGGPIVNVCVEGGGPPSTVLVAEEEERNCRVTFRLDETKLWENRPKPEFLTNPNSTKKDGIDVVLTVEDEKMREYLCAADDWMVSKAVEEQRTIFGHGSNRPSLTPDALKVMYQPCLKTSDKYAPTIRVKVWLAGPEFLLTTIKVASSNGTGIIEEGRGWEFLKKHLGEDKLLHFKVGVHLEFRSVKVWNQNQKFSLSMDAKTIFFFKPRSGSLAADSDVPFSLESLMRKVTDQAAP